ncbi:hypothetical protein PR048_030115 [Dryococelus australis]|uniref:Uncharacterized protein n=1 Tax=Dryococelus australis TaxID=614101 RepID=A0ABQ9G8U2_9NEOP|nr:hypothetical protein PR048_030115 [Dryococelus australis]
MSFGPLVVVTLNIYEDMVNKLHGSAVHLIGQPTFGPGNTQNNSIPGASRQKLASARAAAYLRGRAFSLPRAPASRMTFISTPAAQNLALTVLAYSPANWTAASRRNDTLSLFILHTTRIWFIKHPTEHTHRLLRGDPNEVVARKPRDASPSLLGSSNGSLSSLEYLPGGQEREEKRPLFFLDLAALESRAAEITTWLVTSALVRCILKSLKDDHILRLVRAILAWCNFGIPNHDPLPIGGADSYHSSSREDPFAVAGDQEVKAGGNRAPYSRRHNNPLHSYQGEEKGVIFESAKVEVCARCDGGGKGNQCLYSSTGCTSSYQNNSRHFIKQFLDVEGVSEFVVDTSGLLSDKHVGKPPSSDYVGRVRRIHVENLKGRGEGTAPATGLGLIFLSTCACCDHVSRRIANSTSPNKSCKLVSRNVHIIDRGSALLDVKAIVRGREKGREINLLSAIGSNHSDNDSKEIRNEKKEHPQIRANTRQKAKSKNRNRIRLERASQKQSSDTHKTQYDRAKWCRERKINIKAPERVNDSQLPQPGTRIASNPGKQEFPLPGREAGHVALWHADVRAMQSCSMYFHIWESCRTMPLIGEFSRGSSACPHPCIPALLHTHLPFTLIGSRSLEPPKSLHSTRSGYPYYAGVSGLFRRDCRVAVNPTLAWARPTPATLERGIGLGYSYVEKRLVGTRARSYDGCSPTHAQSSRANGRTPRLTGFNSKPGHLRMFECGRRAGRCRWSAGFLGVLPFAPSFHSGTAPYSPQSPGSALKTSLSRAATHSSRIRHGLPTEYLQTQQGCTELTSTDSTFAVFINTSTALSLRSIRDQIPKQGNCSFTNGLMNRRQLTKRKQLKAVHNKVLDNTKGEIASRMTSLASDESERLWPISICQPTRQPSALLKGSRSQFAYSQSQNRGAPRVSIKILILTRWLVAAEPRPPAAILNDIIFAHKTVKIAEKFPFLPSYLAPFLTEISRLSLGRPHFRIKKVPLHNLAGSLHNVHGSCGKLRNIIHIMQD